MRQLGLYEEDSMTIAVLCSVFGNSCIWFYCRSGMRTAFGISKYAKVDNRVLRMPDGGVSVSFDMLPRLHAVIEFLNRHNIGEDEQFWVFASEFGGAPRGSLEDIVKSRLDVDPEWIVLHEFIYEKAYEDYVLSHPLTIRRLKEVERALKKDIPIGQPLDPLKSEQRRCMLRSLLDGYEILTGIERQTKALPAEMRFCENFSVLDIGLFIIERSTSFDSDEMKKFILEDADKNEKIMDEMLRETNLDRVVNGVNKVKNYYRLLRMFMNGGSWDRFSEAAKFIVDSSLMPSLNFVLTECRDMYKKIV